MLPTWKLHHVLHCFLQSGKCQRAKTIMIICNSPLFFNWYLPANIALRHVIDVINYERLTNIFKLQKYRNHTQTWTARQSHMWTQQTYFFSPNLYLGCFTILQINSSDLEIFMRLEGQKYPWNRVDFVSRELEFLFPSVYRVPRRKHLHPELQAELGPELFRWSIQVTSSLCIYRHGLSQGWQKT